MNDELFEQRKRDHIRYSLNEASQSLALEDWSAVHLVPEALPEINFEDVSLETESLGAPWSSPYFVSSMTAGHAGALNINSVLAEACQARGWLLGLGSQRRELDDQQAHQEWHQLRKRYPNVRLASNIGLSQIIGVDVTKIQRLVENSKSIMLFVHVNPLQECIQGEGTPHFRGGLQALENLVRALPVPIVVKEVGSGISFATIKRLEATGVSAIDIGGRGGTHWGRVEGLRALQASPQALAAQVFSDWGISTPKALYDLSKAENLKVEVWASGGIRNGLQAAKCLAMGARRVGLARPFLEKALIGPEEVLQLMAQLEYELKISLFCMGIKRVCELKQRKVWIWEKE